MAHKLPLSDIRFLTDFHAYCLTRGSARYNFSSCVSCATAQFLRDTGRADAPSVHHDGWSDGGKTHPLPAGMSLTCTELLRDGGHSILRDGGQTFSALATRLEALLADAPVVELAQ